MKEESKYLTSLEKKEKREKREIDLIENKGKECSILGGYCNITPKKEQKKYRNKGVEVTIEGENKERDKERTKEKEIHHVSCVDDSQQKPDRAFACLVITAVQACGHALFCLPNAPLPSRRRICPTFLYTRLSSLSSPR